MQPKFQLGIPMYQLMDIMNIHHQSHPTVQQLALQLQQQQPIITIVQLKYTGTLLMLPILKLLNQFQIHAKLLIFHLAILITQLVDIMKKLQLQLLLIQLLE